MSNDLALEKCRYLASYEKLSFLRQITDQSLDCDTLLDLQHQTILRVIYQYDKQNFPNWIAQYCASPSARRNLHEKAKTFLEEGLARSCSLGIVIDAESYEDVKKICRDEFSKIIESMFDADNNVISFANNFGFAYMPIEREEEEAFGTLAYLEDLSMSSVGAMMFYAFNVKGKSTLNFITSSINVLSFSFQQYLNSDLVGFKPDFRNKNIKAELLNLPKECQTQVHIAYLIHQFLTCHEKGHLRSYQGNQYLLKVFDNLKISHDEFYETDFPSSYDLKSWERVKAGEGRPRDIFFLLGDYLANVAALQMQDFDKQAIKILRAFHWWLAREPKYTNRPRANINFLRYTDDLTQMPQMLYEIEDIFDTCMKDPKELRNKVYDVEYQSWEYLKEKKYVGSHN